MKFHKFLTSSVDTREGESPRVSPKRVSKEDDLSLHGIEPRPINWLPGLIQIRTSASRPPRRLHDWCIPHPTLLGSIHREKTSVVAMAISPPLHPAVNEPKVCRRREWRRPCSVKETPRFPSPPRSPGSRSSRGGRVAELFHGWPRAINWQAKQSVNSPNN